MLQRRRKAVNEETVDDSHVTNFDALTIIENNSNGNFLEYATKQGELLIKCGLRTHEISDRRVFD